MDLEPFALIPPAFALIGGLILWWSVRQQVALRRFKTRAARAVGVCTSLRSEHRGSAGDSSVLYFPVVRFTLPDGRQVETETMMGTSPPAAREGQQVTVLYDPDRPTAARIDGFWADGTLAHGVTAVIGAMFLLMGLAGTAIGVWVLTSW